MKMDPAEGAGPIELLAKGHNNCVPALNYVSLVDGSWFMVHEGPAGPTV